CGTDHRPNFAHSPPLLADLDNNGVLELVLVGNVYNCATNPYTSLYEMPFIFNQDRTRWSNASYNWTDIPVPDGAAAPRSDNYNVIESSHPVPVVVDLDGDGIQEILYPSYDGRMHAYWLDKTEHGNWPYSVTKSTESFLRFASPPVIADLDNDGHAEVIFASWVQKDTHQTGYLHMLDYLGNPLHEIKLPAAFGSPTWNGVLASPTLANIDSDSDLEVVLTSAHSGFLAYDLPGTANARVLWATGRGNFLRSGSPVIQVVYDHIHFLPLVRK
ncbi:MAG: VCBS repeat-containing protein, partial [Anaerolineaceae bacterium]|nr:VCBS repeat-containing protein [Anaerolineaceae bacterium]